MRKLLAFLMILTLLAVAMAEAQDVIPLDVEAEPTRAAEAAEGEAEDEAEAEVPEVPGEAEAPEAPDEAAELPAPSEVEALTAEPSDIELWFEEGFGLDLPQGWVSYPMEGASSAIRYALGDGSGEHFLYIELQPTALEAVSQLSETVEGAEAMEKTGELVFGDTTFVTFIDASRDVNCCATLWGDQLLTFAFTPQSDADYMLTATRIMGSFKQL